MKKYAILLSHNNFLHLGLKHYLRESNILFFHENEINKFLNLCSGAEDDEVIVFYDDQFSKITPVIFHDRGFSLINITQLKKERLHDFLLLSEEKPLKAYPSHFKSTVMEKKAIYYYAFYKMTYREIAKKMQITETRVSYFINNYVKGMNFRNKNYFIIHLKSM